MGRRNCPGCCPRECFLWPDAFARASIGSDWDQVLGSWSIDGSFRLTESGTSGATIATTNPVFPRPFHHLVKTTLLADLPVGAKPRVIANYLDADNYFFAEFEKLSTAPTQGTLRIFRRAGGSDGSALATLTDAVQDVPSGGEGPQLEVCFTSETFAAHVSHVLDTVTTGFVFVCDPEIFTNGNFAGLGNGHTTVVKFVDFVIQELEPSPGSCPTCTCTCEGKCIEPSLLGTITSDGGCSHADVNGGTFPLTKVQGGDVWDSGEFSLCGLTHRFFFGCENSDSLPSGTPDIFGLWPHTFDIDNCNALNEQPSLPLFSVSCDPLIIVFGPLGLAFGGTPNECPCCDQETEETGTAFITITEAP